MRLHLLTLFLVIFFFQFGNAQSFTAYFTGNTNNIVTSPMGGICMMGGSTEEDEAMKWFLERANGGDVLVIRASGSDGYNEYMYAELGIPVNSVETIVWNEAAASEEVYIHTKIRNAEAIWIAGGNQWNYVSFWRDTAIDSLINAGITERNIVIGGTSAGMAILGGYYFSAENNTITSESALANPYDPNATVDSQPFLDNAILSDVITDTHYDDPDRKGRHVTFLARILTDYGINARGIACDEFTAVCIGADGIAHVYGQYPDFDDNAYFIQTNCELDDFTPENCSDGNTLNWNREGKAIKTYAVKGTLDGTNTFDLKDWKTGNGGVWQNWYVDNGSFMEEEGGEPECVTVSTSIVDEMKINIFPNPVRNSINLECQGCDGRFSISLMNALGQVCHSQITNSINNLTLDVDQLANGLYTMRVRSNSNVQDYPVLIIN